MLLCETRSHELFVIMTGIAITSDKLPKMSTDTDGDLLRPRSDYTWFDQHTLEGPHISPESQKNQFSLDSRLSPQRSVESAAHITTVSQNGASKPSVRTPQFVSVDTSPERNADKVFHRSCKGGSRHERERSAQEIQPSIVQGSQSEHASEFSSLLLRSKALSF